MSDLQSTEFLKLLKVSFDLSTNVLRAFTSVFAIDSRNNGTLHDFLEKHKHDYFHQVNPYAVCCGCNGSYKPSKKINKWIYNKIYKTDSTIECQERANAVRNGYKIHFCICQIIPLSNNIDQLDIGVLLSLLYQHGIRRNSLDELREVRNIICHAHNTQSFDRREFDNIWNMLENATIDLAEQVDKYLCRSIKDAIKFIRNANFDTNETRELHQQLHNMTQTVVKGTTSLVLEILGEMREQINSLEARVVMYETAQRLRNTGREQHPTETSSVELIAEIESTVINEEQAISGLQQIRNEQGRKEFQFKDIEHGCILLKMSSDPEIFKNENSLRFAIKSLLERVIKAAAIDTSIKNTIDISLTFTSSITKEQMKVVQNMLSSYGASTYDKHESREQYRDDVEYNDVIDIPHEYSNVTLGEDKTEVDTCQTSPPRKKPKLAIELNRTISDSFLVQEVKAETVDENIMNVHTDIIEFKHKTEETKMELKEIQNIQSISVAGSSTKEKIAKKTLGDSIVICKHCSRTFRCTKCIKKETVIRKLLEGNQMEEQARAKLPEAVKQMTEKDIHQFIELIKSGVRTEKRFCFRTIIVGKNGAGKTSLRRRLMMETANDILQTNNDISTEDGQPKSSTDGVDIDVHSSRIPIKDGEVVINTDWIVDNDKTIEMKHRLSMAYVEATQTDLSKKPKQTNVKPSLRTKVKLHPKKISMQLPECHKQSKVVENTSRKPESKAMKKHEDSVLQSTELQIISNIDAPQRDKGDTPETQQSYDDTETHLLNLIENMDVKMPLETTRDEYAFSKLWDLSGQKHFYATHQVFLTCAAIYLLTVDLSDDLKKRDSQHHHEDFEDVGDYIDFWLDCIHCYSSARTAISMSSIEPPVIVVCTNTDKYEGGMELEKRKIEYDSYFMELIRGQDKGKHINEEIIYLSNTTDPDERFADLRSKISAVARSMTSWGDEIPQKWILLETAIEQIRAESDVVRLSLIVKAGKHENVRIDNEDEIKLFLMYHHELGNIIYFSEKYLEDFVILNPIWLIDAFKCIVSHKISNNIKQTIDWGNMEKTGIMTDSLLDQLLKKDQMHNFLSTKDHLVKCLEKFDILIPVHGTNSFYIPSMMRKVEISNLMKEIMTDPSNWKRTSWLILKFEFLPPPFFQHIIAFFTKTFLPNYRDNKPDLYRGIGVFNLSSRNDPEKLVICVSLNMIAIRGLVCTSKGRNFHADYSRIRIQLEKIVSRIKRRYSLCIHYLIGFGNDTIDNITQGGDFVQLEDLVYMDSCGLQYNSGDTNYDPKEIYNKWYTVDRNRQNTENVCLKHNLEWKSTVDEFLIKIEYWVVCSIDAVCTCSEELDKVWNNVSKEHIAVAHEVYKKSDEFRTRRDGRNVSAHEELYSKLLENDMFLGHSKSSADRLVYVLFIENKGFSKCDYNEMFTWTIFDDFKLERKKGVSAIPEGVTIYRENLAQRFRQNCHMCNKEPSVYWCHDCRRSMCKDCNNQHKESEQTLHHIVQYVQDKCHICNKESSVYWCYDCQRSMCNDCNNQHGESDQTEHHIVQHVQDEYALDYKVVLNVEIIIDLKMLNDGLLVVGNWGGKQLVTLHKTRQAKPDFILLPGDPYRIALVDNNTVAVTLPKEGALVIVDVRKKEIMKRINVKVGTGGIIHRDNQFFVFHSKTIKIINMSGEVTNTIPLAIIPNYICDNGDGLIYCIDENKLHCVNEDGKIVATLANPDLSAPVGISIDDDGQWLVTSEKSNNVLRISPDGTRSKVVIKQIASSDWFEYIWYDSQSKSIVIGTDKTVYYYTKL